MVIVTSANLAVHSTLSMGSLPSQAEQPQRATARTLAIQTYSLKAISARMFTLLSLSQQGMDGSQTEVVMRS